MNEKQKTIVVNVLTRGGEHPIHLVDKSGLVLCDCILFPIGLELKERVTVTEYGQTMLCPTSKKIYEQMERAAP